MSSCLILQEKNRIFLSADTAVTTTLLGTLFRLNEDGKKIFTYNNKIILFLCGKMQLIDNVSKRFENTDYSIETLKSILKDEYEIYTKKTNEYKFIISGIVGTIENGISVMYDISDYNNFEIVKTKGSPIGIGVFSAGIRGEECYNAAIKYIKQKNSVQNVYKKTINEISFEGIGGTLTVYYIDNNGVHLLLKEPIKEKPNLRRMSDINKLAETFNKNY